MIGGATSTPLTREYIPRSRSGKCIFCHRAIDFGIHARITARAETREGTIHEECVARARTMVHLELLSDVPYYLRR